VRRKVGRQTDERFVAKKGSVMTLRGAALLGLIGFFLVPHAATAAQIINLTQTGCQFLESENGVDHEFKPLKSADCEKINKASGPDRLGNSKVLRLKPGAYIFRVKNKNVPYELGFWIRDQDYDWRNPLHLATKTSVSGGGLVIGKTQDYEVTLKPGEYFYSCPLNPTPNYRIIVSN
jgi:hypothetical protein